MKIQTETLSANDALPGANRLRIRLNGKPTDRYFAPIKKISREFREHEIKIRALRVYSRLICYALL